MDGIKDVGTGVVRVQFQGALKFTLRGGPIPVAVVNGGKHGVGFRNGVVDGERLFGVDSGLGTGFGERDLGVVGDHGVKFRQAKVGKGVVGILVDSLFEEVPPFVQ